MQGGVNINVGGVGDGAHDETFEGASASLGLLVGDEGEEELALEEEDSFVVLQGLGLGCFVGVDGGQGPGELFQPEDDAEDVVLIRV